MNSWRVIRGGVLLAAALVHPVSCLGGLAVEPAPTSQVLAPADTMGWPGLSSASWVDPDEAGELLDLLEEAGLLLDDADRAQLGLPVAGILVPDSLPSAARVGRPEGEGERRSLRLVEESWVRSGGNDGAGTAGRAAAVRLDLAAGAVKARVRGRFRDGQGAGRGATLFLEKPSWRLGAGGLGLAHGAGLLVARPGSWTGSGAATPLFSSGDPKVCPATGLAGAIEGVAAAGSWEAWRVVALAGARRVDTGLPVAERHQLLQMSRDDRGGRVSALLARWGHEATGLSVALARERSVVDGGGKAGRARLSALVEVAAWRLGASQPWRGAGIAGLALRGRRLGGEAVVAVADGGGAPPLSRRPTCLPGWDGHGWGTRVDWRASAELQLQAVYYSGRRRELTGRQPVTEARRRMELGIRWRPAVSTMLWLRCGSQDQEERGWGGDRSPWLTPAVQARRPRAQVVMGAEGAWDGCSWRIGARSLVTDASPDGPDAGGVARRSLIQAEFDWRSTTRSWLVRLRAVQAWGDPVDLQAPVFPLPGRVTLRHWGGWASEVGVGLERRRGAWRAHLGLSARRPVPPARAPLLELWQGVARSW